MPIVNAAFETGDPTQLYEVSPSKSSHGGPAMKRPQCVRGLCPRVSAERTCSCLAQRTKKPAGLWSKRRCPAADVCARRADCYGTHAPAAPPATATHITYQMALRTAALGPRRAKCPADRPLCPDVVILTSKLSDLWRGERRGARTSDRNVSQVTLNAAREGALQN